MGVSVKIESGFFPINVCAYSNVQTGFIQMGVIILYVQIEVRKLS